MIVTGHEDCACADFAGHRMPERGPVPVYLRGPRGVRQALVLLRGYHLETAREGGRYHGGVHVDGVHVDTILGDDGEILFESSLHLQSRLHGRLLTPEELWGRPVEEFWERFV